MAVQEIARPSGYLGWSEWRGDEVRGLTGVWIVPNLVGSHKDVGFSSEWDGSHEGLLSGGVTSWAFILKRSLQLLGGECIRRGGQKQGHWLGGHCNDPGEGPWRLGDTLAHLSWDSSSDPSQGGEEQGSFPLAEALSLAMGAMPGLRMEIPLWVTSSSSATQTRGTQTISPTRPQVCPSPFGQPYCLHLPADPSEAWQSMYTWAASPVAWPNSTLRVGAASELHICASLV